MQHKCYQCKPRYMSLGTKFSLWMVLLSKLLHKDLTMRHEPMTEANNVGCVWAFAGHGSSSMLASTEMVLTDVPAHCIRVSDNCSFLFTARLKGNQWDVQRLLPPPCFYPPLFHCPVWLYIQDNDRMILEWSILGMTFEIIKCNHQFDLPRKSPHPVAVT